MVHVRYRLRDPHGQAEYLCLDNPLQITLMLYD
jgi:hypothetical protein